VCDLLGYNFETMNEHLQQVVTVKFEIGMEDGKFSASADVPAGETNLTQILPVIRSLSDSFISGVVSQVAVGTGRTVSCKAGCGACCRQIVPISIFEAESLADWIRSLPEDKQQALESRFDQTLKSLAESGLIDRMVNEDWYAKGESRLQMSLDYLRARVPCPFLEDESCSIHPIRPLICREYLVSSDPQYCSNPTIDTVEPIVLPLHFSYILHSIGREVEHDGRGWIPLVFLFAWMKSGFSPGEAISGAGPQVLYEFVKRMDEARSKA